MVATLADSRTLLRHVTIFQDLSDKDLDNLSQRLVPRTYVKDAIIVSQEEEGDSLFIIKTGKVKVTLYGDSGREVILSIFKPGDYFGEMSLIDHGPRSANVIAIDESELLMLSQQAFLKQLEESPRLAMAVMTELCRRLRSADAAIGSLALLDVYGRLAHVLIDLAKREGQQTGAGMTIKERPTQQDLANMVGTTRETVSRALSEFQRRGWVEMRGRALILQPSFSMQDVANRDD
jgi:CRP/FNR family cyclic AMP-dependent transcriptional regulator